MEETNNISRDGIDCEIYTLYSCAIYSLAQGLIMQSTHCFSLSSLDFACSFFFQVGSKHKKLLPLYVLAFFPYFSQDEQCPARNGRLPFESARNQHLQRSQ